MNEANRARGSVEAKRDFGEGPEKVMAPPQAGAIFHPFSNAIFERVPIESRTHWIPRNCCFHQAYLKVLFKYDLNFSYD